MTEINGQSPTEIEKNWSLLAHILGLVPIPLINILGPLAIWFLRKNNSTFIADHAKEAANFQITVMIAVLISAWLCLIFVGFFCLLVVGITDFIFVLTAAMKAAKGQKYRYPLSFRFF